MSYLSGTDPESGQGAAAANSLEMLDTKLYTDLLLFKRSIGYA